MTNDSNTTHVTASCHCGAVTLTIPHAPTKIRHCNCSLCRRYGALWTYHEIDSVTLPDKSILDSYAWGGKNVDFFRCHTCGCVTHWLPRNKKRTSMGINARLLEPELLEGVEIEYKDSSGTGIFR